MNTTGMTTPTCGYCGRPVIGAAIYHGGRAYHVECTRGPGAQQFQAHPLTVETVRQIVREELAKATANKMNDAPYKVDPPVSRELYEENMRNRMAFKSQPPVVMLDKSDVTNWSATDVKLLLDTVRITSPYTPDQLKKIQIFIGLLVEIKEPS